MIEGVYEQLINQLISDEIESLPHDQYYIESVPLKRKDAALFLAQYFSKILQTTLGLLKEDKDSAANQIELANKLIQLLASEIKNQGIAENLLLSEGKILKAVF